METVRVGDILSLQRRPVSVDVSAVYEEIGVRSFGRGIFHKDPVSGAQLGGKRVFEIRPGDLVLSNVFAWEGAVAVATEAEDGKIGSHRFMTFEVDPVRASASYLRYYFLSDAGLSRIRGASPGSAGRNRTLGIKAFENIELPLPDVDKQRAIATRLELIEARVVKALSQLELTGDLCVKLISSLVYRPEWSSDIKITRGWRLVTMGDVLTHVDRRQVVEDDQVYRIAGIYSFGNGLIDRGPILGRDTSYKRFAPLRVGDLVMSRLNGWEGALAVVDERFAGSFVSNEYPIFEIDNEALTIDFLAALAATPTFWSMLDAKTRGSMVRRRRIHPRALLAVEIWLPPIEYQSHLADTLGSLRGASKVNERRDLMTAIVPSSTNSIFHKFN